MESMNVLIVDDSAITTGKISKILVDMGHKVAKICKTGEEAIEAYKELKPDYVTMDITMPGMGGIEATKHIISDFPNALIIVITSQGQEQMVIEAINAGAKGYILKPIESEKVEESINKMIEKYKID